MTTPATTHAADGQPVTPELLCILEMLNSMKKHLVLHGTTDPSSGAAQWNYSAHRRVLKYLSDYVDEAELRNLKNYMRG